MNLFSNTIENLLLMQWIDEFFPFWTNVRFFRGSFRDIGLVLSSLISFSPLHIWFVQELVRLIALISPVNFFTNMIHPKSLKNFSGDFSMARPEKMFIFSYFQALYKQFRLLWPLPKETETNYAEEVCYSFFDTDSRFFFGDPWRWIRSWRISKEKCIFRIKKSMAYLFRVIAFSFLR